MFLLSAAALAAAAVGGPLPTRASITLNLQFPGGTTTKLIGGDQTNTDVPIQVWATVTGTQTINPVPVAGTSSNDPQVQSGPGDYFDGLQYAYYNVVNSNAANTYVAGGIDTAAGKGPTLNATLFSAYGSQAGAVPNTVGGISVGSSTKVTDLAKPRSAAAVFDDQSSYNQSAHLYQELGNDGVNIATNGKSASFLLETINFKPTAYNATNKTTFSLSIPSAAFTQSAATDLSQANWFQDVTSQNLGTGTPPSSTVGGGGPQSGTPSVGTSVVIQDTLAGDANLDGTVNFIDLTTVLQNFNVATSSFARGDFNHDGIVNFTDLTTVLQNFNISLLPVTPSVVTADAAVLADPRAVSLLKAYNLYPSDTTAVPEPASTALLALASGALLARRRSAATRLRLPESVG